MRALLVINPAATATTARVRDVLAGALASELKVDCALTEHRGHALHLARQAAVDGLDLVVALGGDGTVNEVVNGLLAEGPAPASLPALAVLPGGSANVFCRALGVPDDPIEATGVLLEAIREGRERLVGLGRAGETYFTFCAGLGLDAEVVRLVEDRRARGVPATPGLYVRCALRHFYAGTDRSRPALTLTRTGSEPRSGLFLGVVANSAPWTYLGRRPVNPCPQAGFDTGLDVFAVDRLRTGTTLRHIGQMLSRRPRPPHGRHVVHMHDEEEFTFTADRPVAVQIDGDYAGEHERVKFTSVPTALRVIA